ncbi:hypothetical protein WKK05_39175 (plasmid) [Nostoc sp. UHCC 0302]|uniref:hypothetical protein n=1 Tax=Nostoc sp. UHCC 0302 TaxID=3134896 RepID=UPI00311CAFD1
MNTPLPLEPPQSAMIALITLRDYYAPLVSEYEKLYTQAKTNLTHVEALLSNWANTDDVKQESPNPEKQDKSSLSALNESVNGDLADTPDYALSDHDSPSASTELDEFLSPPQFPLIETRLDDAQNTAQRVYQSELPLFPLIETQLDNTFNAITSTDDSTKPPIFPLIETATNGEQQSLYGVEIPMLPQYQSLSRPEAIEQVLAEHIGTIVHIDFIVKTLYGELEPDVLKVVKGRVQSSLTHGKESNKSFSVPGEPGCYTLSLTLLDKTDTKNSSTRVKGKNKKQALPPQTKEIPMLEEWKGQFLIDALTAFLEQNSGKVFGVAEIINGIYGELTATEIREVKNKVLNELSRGHRTGRFTRVPDQLGVYTWDLSLINNNA